MAVPSKWSCGTNPGAFAPRLAQVVECRYFGGYDNGEIALALGVTERTVERDWKAAKAWLGTELGDVAARV